MKLRDKPSYSLEQPEAKLPVWKAVALADSYSLLLEILNWIKEPAGCISVRQNEAERKL